MSKCSASTYAINFLDNLSVTAYDLSYHRILVHWTESESLVTHSRAVITHDVKLHVSLAAVCLQTINIAISFYLFTIPSVFW